MSLRRSSTVTFVVCGTNVDLNAKFAMQRVCCWTSRLSRAVRKARVFLRGYSKSESCRIVTRGSSVPLLSWSMIFINGCLYFLVC